MKRIVTITQQGQITIPAIFRKELNLNRYKKAFVSMGAQKIMIEPVSNLTELGGVLKDKTLKGKGVEDVIKMENSAIAKIASRKYSPPKQ